MANKWLVLVIVLTHHNDACAKKVYALSNKHLKIAYYEWEPMFKINKNPDGSETYSGILGNLVLLMQQRRNITFTLIKEPNGMWGNCQGNNNCTGMIGMVNRKEADFALGMNSDVKRQSILQPKHIYRSTYNNSEQIARSRFHKPCNCGSLGIGYSIEDTD